GVREHVVRVGIVAVPGNGLLEQWDRRRVLLAVDRLHAGRVVGVDRFLGLLPGPSTTTATTPAPGVGAHSGRARHQDERREPHAEGPQREHDRGRPSSVHRVSSSLTGRVRTLPNVTRGLATTFPVTRVTSTTRGSRGRLPGAPP